MIEDCLTQRNLNEEGRRQAEKIENYSKEKVYGLQKFFKRVQLNKGSKSIDLGDVIPLRA